MAPSESAGNGSPRAWSAELQGLLRTPDDRPISLHEMLVATRGQGYHLLLLLIALPFVGPIPLPGFSVPFGLLVTLLGLHLALGRGPWIPRRLMQRRVSPATLRRLVAATGGVMQVVERVVRPRWGFVPNHAVFSRIAGGLITVSGGVLMLPLPFPFSNALPAWTVILLSAGALGSDGLFFCAGCVAFVVSLALLGLLLWSGAEACAWVRAAGLCGGGP